MESMMNNKFAERLEEYLSSELTDYGLGYSWEWNEDCQDCEVSIWTERLPCRKTVINFRFKDGDLLIETSEDSFYVTREYDNSVKHLWMKVGAELFYR